MILTCTRFVCVASLMLILCFSRESQADIIGLGDLPGGQDFSRALGVSSDGSVVVGESDGPNGTEAFLWTSRDGIQGLGDLPGGTFRSRALGVSSNGWTVGDSSGTNGAEAFRWSSIGGLQSLGVLPGGNTSTASSISLDGSVIVGASGGEAFRWTSGGGLQGLGDLPGGDFDSYATAVSSNGLVVVGAGRGVNGTEAFRWTSVGGLQGLGLFPGGSFSAAWAVSSDGSVVAGFGRGPNGVEGFRWTKDGLQGLGDLPGGDFYSNGAGVSADGSVIVGESEGPNGNEAYIWDNGNGMRSLFDVLTEQGDDLSNWTSLRRSTGISADGRTVVGYGINSSGKGEAFLATIDPVLLGDCNRDGVVDFLDISPFISILSAGGYQSEADTNEDQVVNFLDISPFIILLSTVEPPSGIVSVRLQPVAGFFDEGFEVGLRFETAAGEVIASTLWTDFVSQQHDNPILEDYYNSVLVQPVPAGDIVVWAEANVGIGPGPVIPDLDGPLPCRLDISVPEDGQIEIEVFFYNQNCLKLR